MPKVLLLDIETSFKIAAVWGMWKQNISHDQLFQDTYVLTWAAAWLGDDNVMYDALPFHSEYKKDRTNDKAIIKSMWNLLNEADFVVAHNGNAFDLPVLNTRFVIHNIPPPAPYRSIDTLQVARKHFRFTSNRLDSLGEFLKVGRKMDTGGFKLWSSIVMSDDRESWNKMMDYNIQDVQLLEKVYNKLKAYDKNHPSFAIYKDHDQMACNTCGSTEVHKRGKYFSNTGVYQRFVCNSCGAWGRSRYQEPVDKDFKHSVLRGL